MEIFKLFGSVFIDNEKANKSIDETDGKGKSAAATLGNMVGTAAKWGGAVYAGAGVALGGMLALVNKTAAAADEIDKLSERTGINREELQRWKYAAGQSGADIGKLEVGMKKLSDVMDGATNGNKTATGTFEKLGISLDDLKNKSQSEIFDKVMSSLADMEQGAERNALGNDVLGKSYTELLPLLNAGAGGMDALKARADELGLVMSEEGVKANVIFGDTMDDVKQAMGAMVAQVGTALIPILMTFLTLVLDNMPTIQAVFSTVFGAIGTLVNGFIESIARIVESVTVWAGDNQATIALWQSYLALAFETVQAVAEIAFAAMGTAISLVSDAIVALMNFFVEHWDIVEPILAGILAGAVTFGIYTLAINVAAWATKLWTAATALATKAGTAFGAVLAFITSPIGIVVIAIGLLVAAGVLLYKNWDKVKEVATNVFGSIKAFVTPIIDGIGGAFKGMVNGVITGLNFMVRALNLLKFEVPKWVPGIGGGSFGFNLKELPLLAEGGDINRGGMAIVGEAGPELLNLPTGARVTPLGNTPTIVFDRGAFEGANIMDDYGVDRLMDRVFKRLKEAGYAR